MIANKTCVSYLLVKNNKACVSIGVYLTVGLIHCGVSRMWTQPPRSGHIPANFWPMSVVAKRLDGPRCHLLCGRPCSMRHCVTWLLGFTRVHRRSGISIGLPFCRAHDGVRQTDKITDRPTDTPFCCLCNNKPHQASRAVWRRNHNYYY